MNKITTIRITPTAALPATGLLPADMNSRTVMNKAPTAGPAQWREPPRQLISTTVSGTTMVSSCTVELTTNSSPSSLSRANTTGKLPLGKRVRSPMRM